MNAPFAIAEASAADLTGTADLPQRGFFRSAWFRSGKEPACKVVTARNAHGVPLATFPLRRKPIGPLAINEVAGAYWPFRGVPVDASCGANELTDAMRQSAVARELGKVWRLGPVIEDDLSLKTLIAAAQSSGWSVLKRPVGSIFALDLETLTASGTWPSTKGQQKDRWRVRQLEKTGPVAITRFTGLDWTAETRDAIATVEANSWVGQLYEGGDTKFLNPELRAYWEGIAADPAIAAMIRGSLLTVGEAPAAFTFGLDCGDTRYLIANNFDQRFNKHSPGRVLLYDDFTHAASRGIARIDWGIGDGGYKRQMGAHQDSPVADLLFVRGKLLAALLKPLWSR
ncbi:GNAT family N-acetyltransferase [Erythrobacter sp. GH1-10]|uniref:GNAT family N-acetyltransferase n=1 Tax=Erythrobacter sp. GH1-10 TaxID=3349334 RepID=UPI003877A55B